MKGIFCEVRMFALDRIKMLRVTDEKFNPPKDFSLHDFMRHSFQVMHDDLYMVKVRISPSWARWVGEKNWHESQKAKKNGDGSLEITFTVAGLDEIKRWILSFGPEVVVLEPEKLKKLIHQDLKNTLSHYAEPPIPPISWRMERKRVNSISTRRLKEAINA